MQDNMPTLYASSLVFGNSTLKQLHARMFTIAPLVPNAADDGIMDAKSDSLSSELNTQDAINENDDTSRVLCMYHIPGRVPLQEMYQFVECSAASIQHVHVVSITGLSSDTYGLLLAFADTETAFTFRQDFHKRPYNSLEPDLCYLSSVKMLSYFGTDVDCFPIFALTEQLDLTQFSLIDAISLQSTDAHLFDPASVAHATASNSLQTSPRPDADPDRKEACSPISAPKRSPVSSPHKSRKHNHRDTGLVNGAEHACPVCLDPVSTATSLTILCTHVFHFECLSKWTDSRCPLCRCPNLPALSSDESECAADGCHVTEQLWICLLCGFVGCGFYQSQHAVEHYQLTGHTFSLDVVSRRVWNYDSNGFVHRLILNQDDMDIASKPVQLTRRRGSLSADPVFEGSDPSVLMDTDKGMSDIWSMRIIGLDDEVVDENLKLESLLTEFTHLLDQQLKEQRIYFTQRIKHEDMKHEATLKQKEALLAETRNGHRKQLKRRDNYVQNIAQQKKTLAKLTVTEEKATKRLATLRKLHQSLASQQETNRAKLDESVKNARQDSVGALMQECKAQELRIVELNEQLNDLNYYMKTQKAVAKSAHKGQIAKGQVIMTTSSK